MRIGKILIYGFLLLLLGVTIFIITMFSGNKNNWAKTKSINSIIVNFRYPDKTHEPLWKMMTLADSQEFNVPNKVFYTLQVGDSIRKDAGSNFYIFTLRSSNKKIKTSYQ